MINDFIYEFEITLPDGEVCYQVNNSPKLTKEFIDFLEDIDIDIYTKVLVSSSLTFTPHLAAQTAYGHHCVAGRVNNCWAGLGP